MMKKVIAARNPIIPGEGVCDPHIHIFNNKAYLYATHDLSRYNSTYVMKDWEIWSSGDLVEWQKECVITPEETYMGSSNICYATDAAERNGKYDFTTTMTQPFNGLGINLGNLSRLSSAESRLFDLPRPNSVPTILLELIRIN